MRKIFFGKKGLAAATAILAAALMLTGCGKISQVLGNKTGSEIESGSAESSEAVTGEAIVTEDEGEDKGEKSFASKITGNYSYQISGDEVALLSVYNVGGNLYGYLGLAMEEEGVNPEDNVYSYCALEIMPTSAGITLSPGAETAEAGFMVFSDMSNLSRYWDMPRLGVISLTDNGIKIVAKDDSANPLYLAGTEMNFVRDSSIKGFFTYDVPGDGDFEKQPITEDLSGFWQAADDETCFMEFMKGSDDKTFGFQIYEKKPGKEVSLGRGTVVKDVDGNFHANYRILGSSAPSYFEFTVEDSGADSVKIHSGDRVFNGIEPSDEGILLNKTQREEIPLVTCFAVDDAKAYGNNLTINAPDMKTRTVLPQLLEATEVENNGGYFVRADKFVFFRYFANDNMPSLQGFDGNFLYDKDQAQNSCICYYDTVSGKTGVACRDGVIGPLYYLNGKFVSEYYDVNDAYSVQYLMSYYPDGSGAEYLHEENFSNILGISEDGEYLAWNDFNSAKTYVADGFGYPQEYEPPSYEDVLLSAQFCNGKLILLYQNGESGFVSFEMIDPIGEEKTALGGFNVQDQHEGFVRFQNAVWEEGDIYAGLAWVDNAEIITDFTVVKLDTLNPGEPELVYDEYPECCKNGGYPYFGLNYANEIIVNTHSGNEVGLSEFCKGDLVWYDSILSAGIIAKDYLKENPFLAKKGDTVTILQKAEIAGDSAFVIKAEAKALEDVTSADFDGYTDFVWKGYTYSRIKLDSIADNGVNYTEEEIEITGLDSFEPVNAGTKTVSANIPPNGPFVANNAKEAFQMVTDTYKKAIEEGWDRERATEEGLADSVFDSIWPGGFEKGGDGGYVFYDIDGNGEDELIILYGESILAVYGFNGQEADLSFNVPYRHEAFLYEDGKLQVLFGTMNSAAEYWYRYHTLSAEFLPIVEKTYVPDKDKEKNVECFIYSAELDPSGAEKAFLETGMFPVWAWEWGDTITEEEFESYRSDAGKVKFPKPVPFSE